jgi:hypothetical protein
VDIVRPTRRDRHALDVAPARPLVGAAARVGLWLLVILGAAGGVVSFVRPLPVPSVAPRPTEPVPPAVVGFAELAAERWVPRSGDQTTATRLDLTAADQPPEDGPAAVDRGAAVAVRTVAPRYWAVTVAVDVVERRDGDALPAAAWFVEVGFVIDRAGQPALAGAPGLVPPPVAAAIDARPARPNLRPPAQDDPFAATIAGFATALLAGSGDVSRYLAPGLDLRAVSPPPFSSVTVDRLGVEQTAADAARARVLVEGRMPGGAVVFVAYELQLRLRDGRWEVGALSAAPTLSDEGPGSVARVTTTSLPAQPGA